MIPGPLITFHADPDPRPELRAGLEAIHPTNPLCRSAYLDVKRVLGFQPWILTLRNQGKVVSACSAYLRTGRLNRALEIPSLPRLGDPETFWTGVKDLCNSLNITILAVNSMVSGCDPIPVVAKETYRQARHEYVIELSADLWKGYREDRKCNIKKARKAGLLISRPVGEAACLEHLRLTSHSLGRRQRRGETDLNYPKLHEMLAVTRGGVGEFFQAVRPDGVALSSTLVLMARRGAIYALAGTSPEGMACGASTFLLHEVMEATFATGKEVFYMTSAAPDSPLGYFKASFGAKPVHAEAAEFLVGSRFRFELGRVAQLLSKRLRPVAARFSPRQGICAEVGAES